MPNRSVVAMLLSAGVVLMAGSARLTAQCCSAEFQAARAFSPGGDVVAIEDLDADGAADMVVGTRGDVSILLGQGDGSFGSAQGYPVSDRVGFLRLQDLNGDGDLDIVAAITPSRGEGLIEVLMGQGDGTFSGPSSYPAGDTPSSVDVDDLDGDGVPDIAAANYFSEDISILIGNGDGTFRAAVDYPVGSALLSLEIADFDGNGASDIVVGSYYQVDTLLGNGDGTFQPPVGIGAGDGSRSLVSEDLDGDGDADLVVANEYSNDVKVFLGNGDGTFPPPVSHAVGSGPGSLSVADLDGDGALDLAVPNEYSSRVAVLLGSGTGTFAPAVSYLSGAGSRSVAVADLDGDLELDLAVASRGSTTILLGYGDGTFLSATDLPTGSKSRSVAVGDLDRDGVSDLVVANFLSDDTSILLGNGDGTFRPAVNYVAGDGPQDIGLADFDGDGFLDVAVACSESEDVGILLGNGDGTLRAATRYAAGVYPGAIAIEDFDRDGVADLVIANWATPGTATILMGNGDGTFQAAVGYLTGNQAAGVTIEDLDGDGVEDLAVANYESEDVSILLGNGDGTFQTAVSYLAGRRPYGLAIEDLNGDGVADLAVTNYESFAVTILLGGGDGTFGFFASYGIMSGTPIAVAIVDLDGDGARDLAVTNRSSEVSILMGDGRGGFVSGDRYGTGAANEGIVAADLNVDGLSDLAVANFGGSVTILLGAKQSCPSTVDVIAGMGLGAPNSNEVRVFDAAGVATGVSFAAYGSGQWGVNVASGFVQDGSDEAILTGPGPGTVYGPHVRGFTRGGTPMPRVSFYAYGTLRYGVNVGSGNFDVDCFQEIVAGAGPGAIFGPHVRGFDSDGGAVASIPGLSFYAYGTLKYGANVADGDLDGDATAELLTGPGPGLMFGPQVRGWNFDGGPLLSIAKINFNAFSQSGYGAVVGGGDVDADGFAEIAAAPGPALAHRSRYLGYDYDGAGVSWLPGFDVRPYPLRYGGRMALEDLDADFRVELVTGPGPDPTAAADVYSYFYDGTGLILRPGSFIAFGSLYGVNVAVGSLGW